MSNSFSAACCGCPTPNVRKDNDLNRAYAFLSEPTFGEAARSLVDKLVAMGFEEEEAFDSIESTQELLDEDSDLFSPRDKPETGVRVPNFSDLAGDTGRALRNTEDVTVREKEGRESRDFHNWLCQ